MFRPDHLNWLTYQGTHPWRKVPPSILFYFPCEHTYGIFPQINVSFIFYQRHCLLLWLLWLLLVLLLQHMKAIMNIHNWLNTNNKMFSNVQSQLVNTASTPSPEGTSQEMERKDY